MKNVLSVLSLLIIAAMLVHMLLTKHLLNIQEKNKSEKVIPESVFYNEDGSYNEDSADVKDKGYYIERSSHTVDSSGYRKGDTIYIDYYSDGIIDYHYSDGETYISK